MPDLGHNLDERGETAPMQSEKTRGASRSSDRLCLTQCTCSSTNLSHDHLEGSTRAKSCKQTYRDLPR